MRIITVASGKGGVGRTTIAANLGVALSQLGKPTAIIDASLTTPDLALLFKLEKSAYTINDVLAGEASLPEVLHIGPEGVQIAPAAVTLEKIKKATPERLVEALRDLPPDLSFVLIDASGGLKRETLAALRAAKEVLLVATPDMVSVSDCMKTRLIAEFLGLTPAGLVLNRVREDEFEIGADEIKMVLDLPILGVIPEDEGVLEALNKGQPLMTLRPKSPAAKAIRELARRLIRRRGPKA